jgi:hypothetical protein
MKWGGENRRAVVCREPKQVRQASEHEGQRGYQQDAEAHYCKADRVKGGGSQHFEDAPKDWPAH